MGATPLPGPSFHGPVGQASPEVLREVFSGPPATRRDEVIEQMLRVSRAVRSPGYPTDDDEIAARAGRAYDRSHDPTGIARQAVASVASQATGPNGCGSSTFPPS